MKHWLLSALVVGAMVCPVAHAAHEETGGSHEHAQQGMSAEESHHKKHHHAHKKHHGKKKCHGKKCHHKHNHAKKHEHAEKRHSNHEELTGEQRIEQQMEKADNR